MFKAKLKFSPANATEPAWCDYCPPNDVVNGKEIGVCMSMYYDNEYQRLWEAESTTITLGELFQRTHDHVAKFKHQEVSEWGDLKMRDLPMTTFIGDKPIKPSYTAPSNRESVKVELSAAPLHTAKWAAIRSNDKAAIAEYQEIVFAEAKKEVEIMRLGSKIMSEKAADKALKTSSTNYSVDCVRELSLALVKKCGHTLPFSQSATNMLRNICAPGVSTPNVDFSEICM